MSVSSAFTVSGNTVAIQASTSYPAAVQVPSATLGGNQYRIINSSTQYGAFLSFAQNQTDAQNNCVIPTPGSSTRTIYLLPNTDEIITFVPNAWFTAITSSNSAMLYIVPGDGI